MYLSTISFVGLAVASLSFAQNTTVTLYVPGADPQPLVASVVGSDATATTYVLQCAPGTDSSDCGFYGPVTLTEGPATAAYTFPAMLNPNGSLAFTGYIDCSLAGTISAVCTESFGGDQANFPGLSTETYSGTAQPYMPVTITANAEVASATTTGSNAATNTGTGTKSSGSGATSSGGAKTTSASTGGMPAASGNAGWVLAGAVVVAAMMG